MLTELTIDTFEDHGPEFPRAAVYENGRKIAGAVQQPDGTWDFGFVGELELRGCRETRTEALIAIFDHLRKDRYGIDFFRRAWPIFPIEKECDDAKI